MPDFEYDHLLRELEDLEKKYPHLASDNSPTKRVGGEALSHFKKIPFIINPPNIF
jgi:DNA ligase (NAD+)